MGLFTITGSCKNFAGSSALVDVCGLVATVVSYVRSW